MCWNQIKQIGPTALILCLVANNSLGQGQGLIVDQASGTIDEVLTIGTQIPPNQIAQSFTPSLSAVGFIQFSEFVPGNPGNDDVTFAVNLRADAYNGPILSSTDPVILAN